MTLAKARSENLDVYFFRDTAARDAWCAAAEETTGRKTTAFEEIVAVNEDEFRLICAAITKRPRPVIRLVESSAWAQT